MKLEELYDIARGIDAEINPNEVALMVSTYYDEALIDMDLITRYAHKDTEDNRIRYKFKEFIDSETQASVEDYFVRMIDVRLDGYNIRHVNEATTGDYAYRAYHDYVEVGMFAGRAEGTIKLEPRGGHKMEILYSARPDITIETETLPVPIIHGVLALRIKADLYAEKGRWDLYGAFNRRAHAVMENVRRKVNTGHGGWTVKSNYSDL